MKIKEFTKGIGILFLSIFCFAIIYITLQKLLAPFNLNYNNYWISSIFQLTVSIISLLIFILIFKKQLTEEWNIFKANKKECLKIGAKFWLYGLAVMIISNNIIIQLAGSIATNESINQQIIMDLPIFAIFAIVISGPIIEELSFRAAFKKAFDNKIAFVIFTSLLFGGAHLLASDMSANWIQLLYLIPYSALGAAFAISYQKTNTIIPSIIYHALHNAISVSLLFILMLLQNLL